MAATKFVGIRPGVFRDLIAMLRDWKAGRLTNKPPGEAEGGASLPGSPIRFGYTLAAIDEGTEGQVQPYVWSGGKEKPSGKPLPVYNPYADLDAKTRVTFSGVGGHREIIQAHC